MQSTIIFKNEQLAYKPEYEGFYILDDDNKLYIGTAYGWEELVYDVTDSKIHYEDYLQIDNDNCIIKEIDERERMFNLERQEMMNNNMANITVNGVSPDDTGDIDLHRVLYTHQSGSNISLTLDANKYYSFGEVAQLDISLNPLHDASHVGEYIISFYSGLTPTQLSLPANMIILGNSTIRSNNMYMLRIINNICELLTTDTTVAPPVIDPDTPDDSYFRLGDFNDITDDSTVVILGRVKGTTQWYALSNNNGTSSAPKAVAYDFDESSTTIDVTESTIVWKASVYTDGSVTFKLVDDDSNWLYSTATNNGMRVGTNANNKFTMNNDYLSIISRFVGIYNSQDWRAYTTIGANIRDQEFKFLIKK